MVTRLGLLALSYLLAFVALIASGKALNGGDAWIWTLTFVAPLLWLATVIGSYHLGRLGPWALVGALPALWGVGFIAMIYGAHFLYGAYI